MTSTHAENPTHADNAVIIILIIISIIIISITVALIYKKRRCVRENRIAPDPDLNLAQLQRN